MCVSSKILVDHVFKLWIIYIVIPIYDLIWAVSRILSYLGRRHFSTFLYTWGNLIKYQLIAQIFSRGAIVKVIYGESHTLFPFSSPNHLETDFLVDLQIEETRNPTIEGISGGVADVFTQGKFKNVHLGEVCPIEQGSPTPGTTHCPWTVRNRIT